MKIEEIMARAVAGHYGPEFDDCPIDRKDYEAMFIRGKVSGDTSSQDEHIDAMKDAISALEQAGYAIVPVEPAKQTMEKMREAHPMAASVYRDSYDMSKIYKAMIQQANEETK